MCIRDRLERERLEQRSKRDGLTGIYNIAAAKMEITRMLDRHTGSLALAVIDLDGFKEINDRYGHYTGDQVLIYTAKALRESFCEEAVTARLGGDEFIVCVPYTGPVSYTHLDVYKRQIMRCGWVRLKNSAVAVPFSSPRPCPAIPVMIWASNIKPALWMRSI